MLRIGLCTLMVLALAMSADAQLAKRGRGGPGGGGGKPCPKCESELSAAVVCILDTDGRTILENAVPQFPLYNFMPGWKLGDQQIYIYDCLPPPPTRGFFLDQNIPAGTTISVLCPCNEGSKPCEVILSQYHCPACSGPKNGGWPAVLPGLGWRPGSCSAFMSSTPADRAGGGMEDARVAEAGQGGDGGGDPDCGCAAGARGCVRAELCGGLHEDRPDAEGRARRVLVRHDGLLVELVPGEGPAAHRTRAVRDDAGLRADAAVMTHRGRGVREYCGSAAAQRPPQQQPTRPTLASYSLLRGVVLLPLAHFDSSHHMHQADTPRARGGLATASATQTPELGHFV